MKMAKMHLTRASIRRVARITPSPPSSPKSVDEVKPMTDWSSRLRHHSKHPLVHSNGERTRSRTSSSSSVSNDNTFITRRSSRLNGVAVDVKLQYSGPGLMSDYKLHAFPKRKRKTADEKLVCRLESDGNEKLVLSDLETIESLIADNQLTNGELKSLPLKKRKVREGSPEVREGSEAHEKVREGLFESLVATNEPVSEEKTCSKCTRPKKSRVMESLLRESERFMQYPSRTWRSRRSTHNSPEETSPSYFSSCSLDSVDRVEFSFELVPTQTAWYQTFTREEEKFFVVPETPAPFLLPYEMPLESILRRKKKEPRKAKIRQLHFKPIISTRLQSRASRTRVTEEKKEKREPEPEVVPVKIEKKTRVNEVIRYAGMPRKSPRCHASTLAILCAAREKKEVLTPASEKTEEANEVSELLEKLLREENEEKEPLTEVKRKRGRPRKSELSTASPLTQVISASVDQISELVDETVAETFDHVSLSDEEDLASLICSVPDLVLTNTENADNVIQGKSSRDEKTTFESICELDYLTDDRSSSSVYETASEIGSTSTSGSLRNRPRRKRRNLTGWPRSKKRKSKYSDFSESETVSSDSFHSPSQSGEGSEPASLSTIQEESSFALPQTSPRTELKLSKPFQFQRKTLKFVGKRILRQESQRQAPQRLEYWPCFNSCRKPKRRKAC